MRSRPLRISALGLGIGFVVGPMLFPALAATGCTVGQLGDTQIWQGDDGDNVCNGGDGIDQMYAYAGNDDFGGGTGDDDLRMAYGHDDATDGAGNGDVDQACDGNGNDLIDQFDGDGQDDAYYVEGDGGFDTWNGNDNDRVLTYTSSGGCPI